MAYSAGITERALETVIQKVEEHPVPAILSSPSGNFLVKEEKERTGDLEHVVSLSAVNVG